MVCRAVDHRQAGGRIPGHLERPESLRGQHKIARHNVAVEGGIHLIRGDGRENRLVLDGTPSFWSVPASVRSGWITLVKTAHPDRPGVW